MTRRLVGLGALLVIAWAAPLSADPITVREFAARMEQRAVAVRRADAASAPALASAVPEAERVVSGGDTYEIPLDWVRRALDAAPSAPATWPERRRRIADRLEALSAEARMLDDVRRDDSSRKVLTSTLADRRFARGTRQSWQQVLRDRIRQWLADLLSRTAARGWTSRGIVRVIAWTVTIAAIIVLIAWLTRVTLRRRADRPIGIGPVELPALPGHVLALEAAALIREGRLRDGAQAAYRAALRRLEEEGVLRANAASTPRETLRLVAPSHRRAAPLAALTGLFERIWYGSRAAGPDEGARLLGLLRELECLPSERAR